MAFLALGRALRHLLVATFAVVVEGLLPVDGRSFFMALPIRLRGLFTLFHRVMTILAFLS